MAATDYNEASQGDTYSNQTDYATPPVSSYPILASVSTFHGNVASHHTTLTDYDFAAIRVGSGQDEVAPGSTIYFHVDGILGNGQMEIDAQALTSSEVAAFGPVPTNVVTSDARNDNMYQYTVPKDAEAGSIVAFEFFDYLASGYNYVVTFDGQSSGGGGGTGGGGSGGGSSPNQGFQLTSEDVETADNQVLTSAPVGSEVFAHVLIRNVGQAAADPGPIHLQLSQDPGFSTFLSLSYDVGSIASGATVDEALPFEIGTNLSPGQWYVRFEGAGADTDAIPFGVEDAGAEASTYFTGSDVPRSIALADTGDMLVDDFKVDWNENSTPIYHSEDHFGTRVIRHAVNGLLNLLNGMAKSQELPKFEEVWDEMHGQGLDLASGLVNEDVTDSDGSLVDHVALWASRAESVAEKMAVGQVGAAKAEIKKFGADLSGFLQHQIDFFDAGINSIFEPMPNQDQSAGARLHVIGAGSHP